MRPPTLIALTIIALCPSCIGTPQPDPPNLDPSLVDTVRDRGGEFNLIGLPGAVEPPEATLYLVNLDTDTDPVEVTPEHDGSFTSIIAGEAGEEIRIQVRLDDQRSIPVDFWILEHGIIPAERPLAGCLTTSPAFELEASGPGRATIDIVNDCDEQVDLEGIRSRRAASGLIITSAPTGVAPGTRDQIEISFDMPWSTGSEEVVLIEIAAPRSDRRPITVFSAE